MVCLTLTLRSACLSRKDYPMTFYVSVLPRISRSLLIQPAQYELTVHNPPSKLSSTMMPMFAHSIDWQKEMAAISTKTFHEKEAGVATEVLFSLATCIGRDDLFCSDFEALAGTGRLPWQVKASAVQAPLHFPYACTKSQWSFAFRLYLQTHPFSPPARSRGTNKSPMSQPRQMK
jgi:hypothetical protein